MALLMLREYEALDDKSNPFVIVADKLSTAAASLENGGNVTLVQITQKKASVQVEAPVQEVQFAVQVSPSGAVAANCIALPETFIVPVGTVVILQAVAPVACGYNFVGWYRGLTLLSADLVAEITVQAPATGALQDIITATFALAS